MPLYTISSRAPIPDGTKSELAKMIVRVHCGLTGAPPTFVNVIFSEAIPLRKGIAYNILAGVRKGRTPVQCRELLDAIHNEAVSILHAAPDLMEMSMVEIPAAWIMEGGKILPEPGEEDQCEWLQEHEAEGLKAVSSAK